MTKNLVTVYITNFNYGRFIKQAIESVIHQTYRNIELIIVDDGSSDNSEKIITELISKSSKIVFVRQNQKGLINACNLALNIAKGGLIMRLDADDWLHKDAVNQMVGYFKKNKNLGMVFPDYYFVDDRGKLLSRFRRHDFKKVKLFDQPAHGACTMVRTRFLRKIGGYDKSFVCQDGFYLWLKFIKKYKIKNINKPLFYYRQHNSSLSRKEDLIKKTKTKILKKLNKKNKKKAVILIPFRGFELNRNSLILKKLANLSIYSILINKSMNLKNIIKIIINSPDYKLIRKIKKQYHSNKMLYIYRKKNISLFNTPLNSVIYETNNFLKKKKIDYNYLILLNFHYPFLSIEDIEIGLNTINYFKLNQIIAVKKEDRNVYYHNGKNFTQLIKNNFLKRENNEIYLETGAMRIYNKKILNKLPFSSKKTGHTIIDELSSFVINSDRDYKMAKYISKTKEINLQNL